MNTRSHSRARAALLHRNRVRCQVEELDPRLPPGAILGPLGLAGWELGAAIAPLHEDVTVLSEEPNSVALLSLVPPSAFDVPSVQAIAWGREVVAAASTEITAFDAGIPAFDTPTTTALDTAAQLGMLLNAGAIPTGANVEANGAALAATLAPVFFAPAGSSTTDPLTQLVQSGFGQQMGQAIQAPPVRQQGEYGQTPLFFEPNVGQTDSAVQFVSRGSGYTLFLTPTESVLRLQRTTSETEEEGFDTPSVEGLAVRMEYVGANPHTTLAGQAQLPGKVNYLTGNDPNQWRSNVATFGRVAYSELYAGIDLVWYGNAENQLEYDFVVTPGADYSAIGMQFHGVDRLEVDAQGSLLLHTPFGTLQQPRPFTYQEVGGVRQEVASRYTLWGKHVGFALGNYDTTLPVVIDPVLTYSTFLGGSSGEDGYSIAVDAAGSAYVTGATDSLNFPTTAGVFQPNNGGFQDAYVSKLSPDGASLVYSTYLGGNDNDRAHSIAVDGDGNAHVAGRTASRNFPTTAGALQTNHRGGVYEAFVSKLNAAGTGLVWSTYLGGGGNDAAFGVAVDSAGQVSVAGGTLSEDFPVTPTAFQFFNQLTDSFMTRLLANGSDTNYSTYFGSSGGAERANAIAVDAAGMVYVGGQTRDLDFPTSPGVVQPAFGGGLTDGTLIKFDPGQVGEDSRVYATYVGGNDDDRVHGVAVDGDGNVYLTGITTSPNFPTANAFQAVYGGGNTDAFVTKLNATATTRVYSTYLGGSEAERGNAIAVNAAGEAFVTGATSSANFPTLNPIQATLGGAHDAFVTKFSATGNTLVYSTFLGGSLDENISFSDTTNQGGIALGAGGSVYIVGRTESANFPTVNPLQPTFGGDTDAFVAKIDEGVPGVLACFTFTPDSGTITAGTPVTLSVNALDAFFNPVLDYTGEITFFTTDPAGTIPPNYTYQLADMGVATFTNGFVFPTPGQQIVMVYDTATFTIYGYAVFDVV